MHAVTVELARGDVVEIAVPDVLGALRQRDALDLAPALAVEQAELDLRRWPRTARNSFRARPRWRPEDAARRPKAARYRSGTRKIAARGGIQGLTSGTVPSSNVLTAPPFPTLLPPYRAESVLRISRQTPENGTLMR